ncbi:3-isopropylmalate dehydrogenase [bacterium]|nr:3-isopropylmalate dehydrogenase [bacterium]
MRTIHVGLVPGDGIGPEVMEEARRVLEAAGLRFGFGVELSRGLIGDAALAAGKSSLPIETVQLCEQAEGVLLGPVGGAHWSHITHLSEPKLAMQRLHGWLGAYANLRPFHIDDSLLGISPYRREIVRGVDLMVVRDVSAGLYFGHPRGIEVSEGRRVAVNTLVYSESEIERVAHAGFQAAAHRRNHLALATLAKVLESGELWLEVVTALSASYPQVRFTPIDLDQCMLELSLNPRRFDVILAEILAGELLSTQAASLSGSMGLHPSAVLCRKGGGLFSPGHGSAPSLQGEGRANPTAAILAAALMLEMALGMPEEAAGIRRAVSDAIAAGARTFDICQHNRKPLSTRAFVDRVITALRAPG